MLECFNFHTFRFQIAEIFVISGLRSFSVLTLFAGTVSLNKIIVQKESWLGLTFDFLISGLIIIVNGIKLFLS